MGITYSLLDKGGLGWICPILFTHTPTTMPLRSKPWHTTAHQLVHTYTVGEDYLIDQDLLQYDIQWSKAHVQMLHHIWLLTSEEQKDLLHGLDTILTLWEQGDFQIQPEDEDGHTAIEWFLINLLGETGKKVHTWRSRNDQVLVMMRLYMKDALQKITGAHSSLISATKTKKQKHTNTIMPGYTHMQKAMPTTVWTWIGSFEAALHDLTVHLDSTKTIIDQNPLWSVAGYGETALWIDREWTTKKLEFHKTQSNPLYCAMSRWLFEGYIVTFVRQYMFILSKRANDILMFTMSEFWYMSLPDEYTTWSSVMPQKKNYDLLEIVRWNFARVQWHEQALISLTSNLMSWYNRDFQFTKKPLIESVQILLWTQEIMIDLLPDLNIDREKCKHACTPELYATEQAYELVKQGVPFREAYKTIGEKFMK